MQIIIMLTIAEKGKRDEMEEKSGECDGGCTKLIRALACVTNVQSRKFNSLTCNLVKSCLCNNLD